MIGEMRVLGAEGDTKHIWDSENEDQVKAAKKLYDELTGKNYVAFQVDKKGEKGEKMKEFDKYAEKMILVPMIKGG